MALKDIGRINSNFNGILGDILTERINIRNYPEAFTPKGPNQIKTVIEVEPWEKT
jgi:hypothetical protein